MRREEEGRKCGEKREGSVERGEETEGGEKRLAEGLPGDGVGGGGEETEGRGVCMM